MSKNKLLDDYFEWMYHLVCNSDRGDTNTYRRLLTRLNHIDFTYTIPMDANRSADGIDLRYRYGYENRIPNSIVASTLDVFQCSVFEMMVALSIRCEEQIMFDPQLGNRTPVWFWYMIKSLGLAEMNDIQYDEKIVNKIVGDFLNRNYSRNGKGGLFEIRGCSADMRNVEIWCQLNWFLDSIL